LLEKIFSKEKGGISATKERKRKENNFQKKKKRRKQPVSRKKKKRKTPFLLNVKCHHYTSTNSIFKLPLPNMWHDDRVIESLQNKY
jgi:hypothetical protein